MVKTVVILPQAKSLACVEQELFTLLEHTSSPPVFRGFRVARSLGLCAVFVYHCLFFCLFVTLYCLPFDLRHLFTSLVSSNFSVIANFGKHNRNLMLRFIVYFGFCLFIAVLFRISQTTIILMLLTLSI